MYFGGLIVSKIYKSLTYRKSTVDHIDQNGEIFLNGAENIFSSSHSQNFLSHRNILKFGGHNRKYWFWPSKEVYGTFVIGPTWLFVAHIDVPTSQWFNTGQIIAVRLIFPLVINLEVEKVPKSNTGDVAVFDSGFYFLRDHVGLVSERPFYRSIVVFPFVYPPCTGFGDYEGFSDRRGRFAGSKIICHAIPIICRRIRSVPAWISIVGYHGCGLETLIGGRISIGGVCDKSSWISGPNGIEIRLIPFAGFFNFTRTFVEECPKGDRRVIECVVHHFVQLSILLFQEVVVLQVRDRNLRSKCFYNIMHASTLSRMYGVEKSRSSSLSLKK